MATKENAVTKAPEWTINPDTGEYELETTNKQMVVDPADANFQTWDKPGTTVKGLYQSQEPTEVKGTPNTKYTLRTGPGEFDYVSFNGTEKLNRMLGPIDPNEQSRVVTVVYVGEMPTKSGNTFKDFEVVIEDVR